MNRFVIANAQDCMGCKACEIACVISHNDNQYPASADAFLPRIKAFNTPELRSAVTCRHCEDAPCASVCPTQALVRKDNSIQLLKDKCIGCKTCVLACPFGAMSMVAEPTSPASLAHKCDLCIGRPEGQACVAACPTQALTLVSEQTLEAKRKAKQQAMAQRSATHWQRATPIMPTKSVNPLKQRQNWPRVEAKKKPIELRKTTFDEIYHGFSAEQTQDQASRCLSCGNHSICEWTCPLHNSIPHWISLAKQGRILEAVELSHQTSSLPEICGRVCPQDRLCEGACTLGKEFGAVTVGNIERYITDSAMAMGWKPDMSGVTPTGKRAAIIGAGPAGLACADVLARNGVEVTVFDRHPEIGGLLTFGIPPFKLDKKVLTHRRHLFSEMGIHFQLNTEVGKDIALSHIMEEYETLFLGVGTYRSMKAGLENEDAPGVYDALPFLIANTKRVMGLPDLEEEPYISMEGKRVVVLGGGDTAMDCLRTSLRQGAASVTCAYRRDESNMPGSKKEVKNSREEGAEFMFNVQPQKICLDEQGNVCGISLVRTEMGEADASKCIGCRTCEIACAVAHAGGADATIDKARFFPRLKVIKGAQVSVPVLCRQCENAPCASVCPHDALVRHHDSIQVIQSRCIGCKSCVIACPFGAIDVVVVSQGAAAKSEVHKCDLCVDVAASPSCVRVCPTSALTLVSNSELQQRSFKKQQQAARDNADIRLL